MKNDEPHTTMLLDPKSKFSIALLNCEQIFDNCQGYLNDHYPHEITIQSIWIMSHAAHSVYIDQKPEPTSQVVFVNATAGNDQKWKHKLLDFLIEYFAIHVAEFAFTLPESLHFNSKMFELFEQNVNEMNRQTPAFHFEIQFNNASSNAPTLYAIGTKSSLYRKLSDLADLLVYLTNGRAFVYEIEPSSVLNLSLAKIKTIRSSFDSNLARDGLGLVDQIESGGGSFEIRHKPASWTESRQDWTSAVRKIVRMYEEKLLAKIEYDLVSEFDFLSARSRLFREMCRDFQYFVNRKYQEWSCVNKNGEFAVEISKDDRVRLALFGNEKRARLFNERVVIPELRRIKHTRSVEFLELRYDCRSYFKENKIVSCSSGRF